MITRFVSRSATAVSAACLFAAFGLAVTPARADTATDLRWLNRLTYGVNGQALSDWQSQGRKAFVQAQLHPPASDDLPPLAQAQMAEGSATHPPLTELIVRLRDERKRINGLSEPDKQAARSAWQQQAQHAMQDAAKRHVWRALYSPWQLREQMSWFWLNHFNVLASKGQIRWLVSDYEDTAIRPHALGRFKDLVMATLTHPAMLEYLDNTQNAVGHINENHARELLELHTMGVDSGYTQQDVQNLARLLTGLGVDFDGEPPRLRPALRGSYKSGPGWEFNPNRHDFDDKQLLGQRIAGQGWPEIEQAVDLICAQPATARFISRQMAQYFMGDQPPAALLDRMAKRFAQTDGDIAQTLALLFDSREFADSLGQATRDPVHYVLASVRFAYDGKVVSNVKPVVQWLNQLGEGLYAKTTPDGYSLQSMAWTSSGQMTSRFELARSLGSGSAGLFSDDDGKPTPAVGFPMLSNRLFFTAFEPTLSDRTKRVLRQATSNGEWNALLLSSPEWMQR